MSNTSTIYSRPNLESTANCYPFFSASGQQKKTMTSGKKFEPRSVVSEIAPNINRPLQISQPSYSSIENNENFDFLNVLFIAKLRNWLQQTYKDVNIIQDISSLQTKQFKAKVNKTEITIRKNGIFFVAKSDAELKKTFKDVALMLYRNYPGINLSVICADKAMKSALEEVLREAYIAVELEKSPAYPAVSLVKQDDESVFQPSVPSYSEVYKNGYLPGFEPSAPPAEDASAQQSAPSDDFGIPFKSFTDLLAPISNA